MPEEPVYQARAVELPDGNGRIILAFSEDSPVGKMTDEEILAEFDEEAERRLHIVSGDD